MFIRNHNYRCGLVAAILIGLAACSGGSGDEFLGSSHDQNVALASSGSLATANYDNDSAGRVNDGDQTTTHYWAGNITDDYVAINFGSPKQLSSLSVHANPTSASDWVLELSTNGIDWQTTGLASGGDIPCPPVTTSGQLTCSFTSKTSTQYIRLRITATSNIGLIQVYEIEAQGH